MSQWYWKGNGEKGMYSFVWLEPIIAKEYVEVKIRQIDHSSNNL